MKRLDRRATLVVLWAVLLTAPFWMRAVGGYTELGSRVIVLAMAAMALNFLLGFTGTLSFGHAAYFGLAAYGAGMTIKYLVPSTWAGMLVGIAVGTLAAALIGVASGITTVFAPSATEAVIYIMMGLVLLVRPRGLLGEEGRLQ